MKGYWATQQQKGGSRWFSFRIQTWSRIQSLYKSVDKGFLPFTAPHCEPGAFIPLETSNPALTMWQDPCLESRQKSPSLLWHALILLHWLGPPLHFTCQTSVDFHLDNLCRDLLAIGKTLPALTAPTASPFGPLTLLCLSNTFILYHLCADDRVSIPCSCSWRAPPTTGASSSGLPQWTQHIWAHFVPSLRLLWATVHTST